MGTRQRSRRDGETAGSSDRESLNDWSRRRAHLTRRSTGGLERRDARSGSGWGSRLEWGAREIANPTSSSGGVGYLGTPLPGGYLGLS